MSDVTTKVDDYVATVEIHRGPHNFFDAELMTDVADVILSLDGNSSCRAIVLCSEGKNFCAGADLSWVREDGGVGPDPGDERSQLYDAAVRLYSGTKPIVAAVQGAAIGGGLGLALATDFRVASPKSRFSANFSRLGFFPGFGITLRLPEVVGRQRSLDLLYSGRRIDGDEALAMGLCDRLVSDQDLRSAANAWASEIAKSGPLSVPTIRRFFRGHLAEAMKEATAREGAEQRSLAGTDDFREGVTAMAERRLPVFHGH